MKIIAVGGGEIGRPGYPVETTKIDKEIIALSGKKKPNLLFIPTASHDSEGYIKVVQKHFGKRLSCKVDTLLLWNESLSKKEINQKIAAADILYVGGGNTLTMLKRWRKLGFDTLLRKASREGKVLSGVSAGAVCWFKYAHSDSRKMKDPSADYIRVRGLDLLPLFTVPHFDAEKGRGAGVKKMLKKYGGVAIAIDNCAALEIVDDSFRIITSKLGAGAYKCFWKGERYYKEKIPNHTYMSLTSLSLKI